MFVPENISRQHPQYETHSITSGATGLTVPSDARKQQPIFVSLLATMTIAHSALEQAHRKHSNSDSHPTVKNERKPRKRLQKAPPRITSVYSCKELMDVVLTHTCLSLFSADDDYCDRTGVEQGRRDRVKENQPQHIDHMERSQPPRKFKPSVDSSSIYSMDEMEGEKFKRTRAKTPCFWIGQLDECGSRDREARDAANALAGQYQAVLPPRSFTPYPEQLPSIHARRGLRKVKGQQSLRDLVTCQELSIHSDSETLVGTPSLGSPTSGHFSWKISQEFKEPRASFEEVRQGKEDGETDVGFQICLDLLTSELASGLFKKHPTENLDRGSGLQILLMIEAYESVQYQIRQEIEESHVTGPKLDQVVAVEKLLDNWLGALYSLHDRAGSTKSNASLRGSNRSMSNSPMKPLRRLSRQSGISDHHLDEFRFDLTAKT